MASRLGGSILARSATFGGLRPSNQTVWGKSPMFAMAFRAAKSAPPVPPFVSKGDGYSPMFIPAETPAYREVKEMVKADKIPQTNMIDEYQKLKALQKHNEHKFPTGTPEINRGSAHPHKEHKLPSDKADEELDSHHDEHDHHHDPRGHLDEYGRRHLGVSTDRFHVLNVLELMPDYPRQGTLDGMKFIVGHETKTLESLYDIPQVNVPFWPRHRMRLWGNHSLICKMEFLFFYIPTFIIISLVLPCYCMIYMNDESVYTTMTVKVIGRQWYWVYEVDAPPAE